MPCPCERRNPDNLREVVKCMEPTLFHKTLRPASLGTEEDAAPETLDYKNVLLVYEANGHAYLYSSDGVPTFISYLPTNTDELKKAVEELQATILQLSTELQQDIAHEALERAEADQTLQTNIDNLGKVNVQKDTALSTNTSTVSITKTVGTLDGDDTAVPMAMPVANADQAGVMNAATYNAVQQNSENINSILNGAIAIDTLPANPTQEQLTEAYKQATGQTEVINRASIYDEPNQTVWYYYENVKEWKAIDAKPTVSVAQATNTTLGIVKGSTQPGQNAVEPDGSMSLNGWDAVQEDIRTALDLIDGKTTPYNPKYVVGGASSPINFTLGSYSPSEIVLFAPSMDTETGEINNYGSAVHLPYATSSSPGVLKTEDIRKLDALPAITSIGENLELTDEGVLNASGGGSGYKLPQYITASWNSNYDNTRNPFVDRQSTYVDIRLNTIDTTTGERVGGDIRLNSAGKAGGLTYFAGVMSGADKAKLDSMLQIKSLNDSLSLDENGQLSVVGGGGGVELLASYSSAATDTQAYSAAYLNSRLDSNNSTILGGGAKITGDPSVSYAVVIGSGATSQPRNANAQTFAVILGRRATSINNFTSDYNIVIGAKAHAYTYGSSSSVAIGEAAVVTDIGSVAIGYNAQTSRSGEVSFGYAADDGGAYSKRFIANVRAGELDTDAVNVKQMQDYVAANAGGSSNLTAQGETRANSLPLQVFYTTSPTAYNADDIEVHLVQKDLSTGGDATMPFTITAATPSVSGQAGHAGVMTAFQATQLAALAESYKTAEAGTVLYEDTASTNYVELSQSANNFDHIVVTGEYMGMGSFALKQQATVTYYPTIDGARAFQMNATDITTGDSPSVELIQDIWSLNEDGTELELASSLKAMVNSETTVTPDTTSNFTITKVVGFGKKV